MGWKPGQAASRTRTGLVEPYLPASRPALLGIGAKEREVPDDGSSKNGKRAPARPERRYVPVVKREREKDGRDERSTVSAPSSRRGSRSPEPERRRERDGERTSDRRRDGRERERDSHRERDREPERDSRRDRDRNRERAYDSDRDYERHREKDRERDRDRNRDREGDRSDLVKDRDRRK